MRYFSAIVLALSLVAAPLAVATPGPDCAKKCSADAKKCNPADCAKSEKCTPEEKAKCAAKKEGKTEAPKAPKN